MITIITKDITPKKNIFLGLFILMISFRLSAQLSDPIIEFDRTWAYQFELLEISVRTPGTADSSRLQIKLIADEGDISIRNKTTSWGSSIDYNTNKQTVFIEHKFRLASFKAGQIKLKAVVQDLQNQRTPPRESNIMVIDIKAQPDILKKQAPKRDAINLNIIKTEINQDEEAILLLEVFSDDWVPNIHLINLKDFPVEILSIKNIKTKKIYVSGKITNLFTLAVKIDSSHPGQYLIPEQEVEVKIRSQKKVDGRKKVRIEKLKTNAVEFSVKKIPKKE